MTKFENIGTELQYAAKTTEEAKAAFENSCKLCALRNRKAECSQCAIKEAHEFTLFGLQIQKGGEIDE